MTNLNPGKLAAVPAGRQIISIVPHNFDEVVRFAQLAVMSGLFKGQTKRKRQNENEEDEPQTEAEAEADAKKVAQAQASMIIMHGLELGISPMQAFDSIAIINGRKCIYGNLIPALLRWHGCKMLEWQTGNPYEDDYTAHCKITRPDGEVIEYSYSVADAKQAKLWQLDKPKVPGFEWFFDPASRKRTRKWGNVENDSNWFKHPKRMLIHRARGFCANDGCSDYLNGLYPAELMDDERQDREPRDITPSKAEASSFVPSAAEASAPAAPKEEPEQSAPPVAEPQQAAQIEFKPDDMLSALDVSLMACKTLDELGEVWDEQSEALTQAGRDTWNKAQVIYEKHEERLKPAASTVIEAEYEFDMAMVPAAE